MENQKQQIANQFWETYFADRLQDRSDEAHTPTVQFWGKLQTALEASDIDTVHAVIYSKPSIHISTGDMYIRIVKTAKRIWDTKRD